MVSLENLGVIRWPKRDGGGEADIQFEAGSRDIEGGGLGGVVCDSGDVGREGVGEYA